MKKGFTLVELSIVLVIIGLLIGGILVAQSMISTAKVQKFVRQINQFDIAVSNFKTLYGTWPGDSAALGCASGASCNNGIMDDGYNLCCPGTPQTTEYNAEIANFWLDLQKTGFVNPGGTLVPISTTNFSVKSPGANSPMMALGDAGVIPDWYGYANPSYFYYFIGKITVNTTSFGLTGNTFPAIKVGDLLAVDKKIDDGLPTPGQMTGIVGTFYGDLNGVSTSCTNGAGRYNVGNSDLKCDAIIRILPDYGN